jgi:hypothetical protein
MLQAHTNLPGLHSLVEHATTRETWCRAPSYKPQASSNKLQATSYKLFKEQSPSYKLCKAQAASFKQGWFESFINFQGASGKRQAPSNKHQAASRELLAL